MNASCECGMTLERPSSNGSCPECGTRICRSCGIQVNATAYCRWCATSFGTTQAA